MFRILSLDGGGIKGLGKSTGEIVEFYRTHGPTIFPGTSLVERVTGGWQKFWGPKHSHEVLREAVSQVLGTNRFGC
jgi:hypothetical protein